MEEPKICRKCRFSKPHAEKKDVRVCHKNPPQIEDGIGYWPNVEHQEWCGCWEPVVRTGN